jgi:hypothetical protein
MKASSSFSCQNSACASPNYSWDDGTPFGNAGLFLVDGTSSANFYDVYGHLTRNAYTSDSAKMSTDSGVSTLTNACEMPCMPSGLQNRVLILRSE